MGKFDQARWGKVQAEMKRNGGHVTAAELSEALGVTHEGCDTYLRRLRAMGLLDVTRLGVNGGGYRSYWHLPGHVVSVRSARQEVLDLLASGARTRPEICAALGKTPTGANSLLHRMRSEGLIESQGRSNLARWFLPGQAPKVEAKPKPAPSRAPMAGPVVIREGLQVQRGPSWTHDKRFQLHPDARASFRGEFSRMGPGRYLEVA